MRGCGAIGPTEYGSDRCSQFVRQSGNELILHAIGGFRVLSGCLFQAQQLLSLSLGLFKAGDVRHAQ